MSNIRYDVQEMMQDDNKVRIIYCAIAEYDSSWLSILHSHPYAELFFCLGGKGYLQIVNEKIPLEEGDFFLINQSVAHTEFSDAKDKLSYIVIGVSGVRFLADENALAQPRYQLFKGRSNAHELAPYFQDILREVSRQREDYLNICMGILNVIFAKIRRSIRMEIANNSLQQFTLDCAEIKNLIDERFAEPLTLDQLAREAHVSKYHLSHSFGQQYGISPIHYLVKRRTEEAQHLLANTTYSLTEISVFCGFSSPSYFSQAFKRITGLRPSEYRRKKHAK